MKKKTRKIIYASLLCFPLFLSSCGEDVVSEEEQNNTGVTVDENGAKWIRPAQKLKVSLPVTDENSTRVVLVDGKDIGSSGVKSEWEKTDNVGVWNITASSGGQTGYNVVHPDQNAKHVNLTGTVNCNQGDKIAVFYPYGGETGVASSSDGKITLSLSKQKGTLDDIAKNFDLVYGETTIKSVSDGEASASLGTLTAGITIFEFQFKDTESNNEQIEMERLGIKVEGGHNKAILDLNNMSSGLMMVEKQTEEEIVDTFYVRPAQPTTKVYIAMFEEMAGKTLHFDIVDKYGVQHKASAKAPASITAGQITRANLKAKGGDYVEIDDLKWAKGNLIWDSGELTEQILAANRYWVNASYLQMTNYFIAPSQEWSPEQLNSTMANMPVWPVAPPKIGVDVEEDWYGVPNPTSRDGYIALFYFAAAAKHGQQSGRGQKIIVGSEPSTAALTTVPQCTFDSEFEYGAQLWADNMLRTPISVEDAVAGYGNPVESGVYFGDLAYLVTHGNYAMPNFFQLQELFTHPNAVWGVYFVTLGPNMKVRYGVTKTGDATQAPIYGLYVNKRQMPTTATHDLYVGGEWSGGPLMGTGGWKGQAFILTADDLKRGIFLPADGIRNQAFGAATFNYLDPGSVPGEICSYVCSTFGAGGPGSWNARHWQARPDNASGRGNVGTGQGRVNTTYSAETRTRTGNIRPIYVGDKYK